MNFNSYTDTHNWNVRISLDACSRVKFDNTPACVRASKIKKYDDRRKNMQEYILNHVVWEEEDYIDIRNKSPIKHNSYTHSDNTDKNPDGCYKENRKKICWCLDIFM